MFVCFAFAFANSLYGCHKEINGEEGGGGGDGGSVIQDLLFNIIQEFLYINGSCLEIVNSL